MKAKYIFKLMLVFAFISIQHTTIVFSQDSLSKKPAQKPFSFAVNGYLWAMALSGSTAIPTGFRLKPQTPVIDLNLKFSDAMKHLKMAAMISGRISYKDFSLLYDMDYAKLGYSVVHSLRRDNYLKADLTAKTFNGDFDIAYKFPI